MILEWGYYVLRADRSSTAFNVPAVGSRGKNDSLVQCISSSPFRSSRGVAELCGGGGVPVPSLSG